MCIYIYIYIYLFIFFFSFFVHPCMWNPLKKTQLSSQCSYNHIICHNLMKWHIVTETIIFTWIYYIFSIIYNQPPHNCDKTCVLDCYLSFTTKKSHATLLLHLHSHILFFFSFFSLQNFHFNSSCLILFSY